MLIQTASLLWQMGGSNSWIGNNLLPDSCRSTPWRFRRLQVFRGCPECLASPVVRVGFRVVPEASRVDQAVSPEDQVVPVVSPEDQVDLVVLLRAAVR